MPPTTSQEKDVAFSHMGEWWADNPHRTTHHHHPQPAHLHQTGAWHHELKYSPPIQRSSPSLNSQRHVHKLHFDPDDIILAPHPQCYLVSTSSRDIASLLPAHTTLPPTTHPTKRWLQETRREEPWRLYSPPSNAPATSAPQPSRHSRSVPKTAATYAPSAPRSTSPQPRDGG
ncbi:hypothetical protein K469DRAFT_233634 [Zopfia rhizophila CBS 207.26]|uniref:Uncharacterized protein n=1 Tax=Zopfia rhizophila CBS 207.26 TaxID=1314779 RepID=A0A6A6DWA1_9PEZI|nr:hypothetical protein K469DRAFT_233634 [Zopfia rhizophila CBS 207.26]